MFKFIEEKIAIPLMLFLAVSVLAIIFWWVQNLDQSFEEPIPEVKTEKQDEFENWQTYRNEEFGFEVKYPEEWVLSEGDPLEFRKDGDVFISISSYDPSVVGISYCETALESDPHRCTQVNDFIVDWRIKTAIGGPGENLLITIVNETLEQNAFPAFFSFLSTFKFIE